MPRVLLQRLNPQKGQTLVINTPCPDRLRRPPDEREGLYTTGAASRLHFQRSDDLAPPAALNLKIYLYFESHYWDWRLISAFIILLSRKRPSSKPHLGESVPRRTALRLPLKSLPSRRKPQNEALKEYI